MVIVTLQQIIDERISFLIEQINQDNKPEVNRTFQLQIDAIRSVDGDIEKVEFIIKEKKALLKNSKDVHESDRLFALLQNKLAAVNDSYEYQVFLKRRVEARKEVAHMLLVKALKQEFEAVDRLQGGSFIHGSMGRLSPICGKR